MRAVVLTGGVGGAKLVLGLARVLEPAALTAIVNSGDDFRHLGLHVSPDIDTLLYTLSGKADRERGWGRAGESWNFMAALRELGGEDWFALGDGDLAMHVLRSWRLGRGDSLSDVTRDFARAFGIGAAILPMSDEPVATWLDTDEGALPFQNYFVARRCAAAVERIRFAGADAARPAPGLLDAIAAADAILIAPSNPYLSVDPILAVPGIADALGRAAAPVVAVSPLVGGKAVKGPTAKLMAELGIEVSNRSIADHYAAFLDGLVIHAGDDAPAAHVESCDILMRTPDDCARVAAAALALARKIGGG